ncbi:S8 family serine peptidase [Streptomyces camelliae]|uniref:S8 family serine peptidase n=1 Tax=Streptomyces camelliae TaxID=3004093 RepID=A0ABY7NYY8_9ACTN|nr:S8 family serine peptidase [Streptomyces sp. HUAS 2-6]WBO63470.1 S8 family serine peptidase [Streptomyces sp. HUAS 2-6]
MSVVCSALGALTIVSTSLAPAAAAVDIRSKQWYLSAMQADEMWKTSTGKGVKVAVIDSGVNPDTPALKGQVLVNEVQKSVSYHVTQDYAGHGTSMAEIIAGTGADNSVKGLAFGAKIIPYRIALDELKDKQERQNTATSAEAIRAAADSDAKIINMSFGSEYYDADEEAAIKYAASKGKLLFAAVGNSGLKKNEIEYPAFYPYVNAISASDQSGTVAKFSEHGKYVDFAAPGVDIPGWCDNTFKEYCSNEGTSAASAIASASAALVWSAHPNWTANQVLRVLYDTASRKWPKDERSLYLGFGLLRPRKVLDDPNINPGPANVDPFAAENATGEDASASPTPSASSGQSTKDADSASGPTSAAAKDSNSGSSTTTWVIVGAAAAVLVIGGAGFAVLRARRNA